jgi:F0F1-type ATP synthase alpha subunit
MAMTDGHIFFDIAEAKKGRHPAVSFTLSVSRVGNQTKTPLEREISATITHKLSEARKAEELGRFGVELTPQTMEALKINECLETLLNQETSVIIPKQLQIILVGLFLADWWGQKEAKEIASDKDKLVKAFSEGKLDKLRLKIKDCETLKDLTSVIKAYFGSPKPAASVINKRSEAAPTAAPSK